VKMCFGIILDGKCMIIHIWHTDGLDQRNMCLLMKVFRHLLLGFLKTLNYCQCYCIFTLMALLNIYMN